MFRSFSPNRWKASEKRKWPPNMKPSRVSTSSDLCRRPYPPHQDGICPMEVTLKSAESALSSFNENKLFKQGPEYDLVDVLNCIRDSKIGVYHCNFIARLQDVREAEDMLFFAELKYNEGPVLRCIYCRILGSRGTKTGQYDCKSCRRHSGLIQHPNDRLSRSIMLSCEADHRPGLWNLGLIFGKVNKSQSLEETKFPRPESASTLSKHPHPDDGNCCNSKLPYPPPGSYDGSCCPEYVILKNVECALSSFNEQRPSKQGPEYELVDALNCMGLPQQGIYHCNFIARLKNGSEAEDKLFFAELEDRGPVLCCRTCCVLGPRGTVTGEYGCMCCLRRPGLIQHPEYGFSRPFRYGDRHADAGRSMLSREADHRSGLWSSREISGMVNKSLSLEESKFPCRECASTLSKHGHPDDGNCFNSKLPYPPYSQLSFGGRYREDMILKNAECTLSSFIEQGISKGVPCPGGVFRGPHLFLCNPPGSFDGRWCPEDMILENAESALSSFNEQSLSKQGPEYELVDALNCMGIPRYGIYHCNFIARLKNESEAEDKLFFAELKYHRHVPRCLLCCILGPRGTVTGEHGCLGCLRRPGVIQHAEDGFYRAFEYGDGQADARRSMFSREADHRSGLCS